MQNFCMHFARLYFRMLAFTRDRSAFDTATNMRVHILDIIRRKLHPGNTREC